MPLVVPVGLRHALPLLLVFFHRPLTTSKQPPPSDRRPLVPGPPAHLSSARRAVGRSRGPRSLPEPPCFVRRLCSGPVDPLLRVARKPGRSAAASLRLLPGDPTSTARLAPTPSHPYSPARPSLVLPERPVVDKKADPAGRKAPFSDHRLSFGFQNARGHRRCSRPRTPLRRPAPAAPRGPAPRSLGSLRQSLSGPSPNGIVRRP